MEQHQSEDELNERADEPWYKGPMKIIVGLFLILILILWLVPHYGVKQNPEPSYIPKLNELEIPELDIPDVQSTDMRSYIQTTPEIKRVADKVVTLSCPETSKVCNAKALFYFVKNNFNYVSDPLTFEHFKTPQESLNSVNGDCDDSSILLSSLLQSVGLQTRFVFVPGHVYIQVRIPEAIGTYKQDNHWINLDPTCKSCRFGEISFRYTDSEKRYLG